MRAALFFLLPGLVWAQDDQAKRIEQLVRELGSENFDVREKATAELRKIGKPATAALKKAAQSDDPEIRLRAKQLLEEFERSEKKPPTRRLGGRISVQSSNGDTVYFITPAEGDPIAFKRKKDGSVELEYTEDGKKLTAKSESLEKFLTEHPELARKYGISRDGIRYGGVRAGFHGGRNEFRFQGQDPEEMFREFEEEMSRLRKRLFEFGFEDEEWNRRMIPTWGGREYVHGASFDFPDEVLRSHLEIPEGSGLVTRKVKEGSLVAELGLKRHDILLEIDGTKVASSKDVRSLLKKESKLVVLRGGKRIELKKEDK